MVGSSVENVDYADDTKSDSELEDTASIPGHLLPHVRHRENTVAGETSEPAIADQLNYLIELTEAMRRDLDRIAASLKERPRSRTNRRSKVKRGKARK